MFILVVDNDLMIGVYGRRRFIIMSPIRIPLSNAYFCHRLALTRLGVGFPLGFWVGGRDFDSGNDNFIVSHNRRVIVVLVGRELQ